MRELDEDRLQRRERARIARQRRHARRRGLAISASALLVVGVFVVYGSGRSASGPATSRTGPAPRRAPGVASSRGTSLSAFSVHGRRARRMRIPILMYHVISAAGPGTPNPELWVAQNRFRAEIRALKQRGYVGITLRQAYAAWHGRGALPPRPVVVSFDDGYLSHYTHAAPALKAVGWPGVLNLVIHNIGPGGLTSFEVKRLVSQGWEIDSHTIDHPDLTTLSPQELRRQLVVSRKELRRRFGVPVDFFCYPSGRVNAAVAAAVQAAGYKAATTTVEGLATGEQAFHLERIRVNGSDTAGSLLQRLGANESSPGATR